MSHPYEQELQIGLGAVTQAAGLCRTVQSRIDSAFLEKADRSPVTVADFGSQALICRMIREAFPDDPIIAEEDSGYLRDPQHGAVFEQVVRDVCCAAPDATGDDVCRWIDHGGARDYHQRFWTLDPIDGTKGFLRKEQYAVSLALIVEGEIAVAVLACPNLPDYPQASDRPGVIFSAVRGQGADVRRLGDPGPARPVRCSGVTDPAKARLCESVETGHTSHSRSETIAQRLGMTAPPVRLDGQGKYGVVARGEAEMYLRLPGRKEYIEKIWDHAGGVLVVTEAGGRVTDVHGKPLNFSLGRELSQNRGVVVTNGPLHDRVLKAVGDVLGGVSR